VLTAVTYVSEVIVIFLQLNLFANRAAFFFLCSDSVAPPAQKFGEPKNFGGSKMFDFRRITLFCLEKRLSKHKMTMFSKHFGGPWPFWHPWLHLCSD